MSPRRFSLVWTGVIRILSGIAAMVTLAVLLVAFGVVAAALAASIERPSTWIGWANIGESFGVLNGVLSGMAFVALVATLWVQYRELSAQRAELRMQRDAIERSGSELRRSADAEMRRLHIELLKMSIEDPALARVWPDPAVESDERRRQLMYANLVFQHLALSMLMGEYPDDRIRETLRYVFESELMREYWISSAAVRSRTQVPGSDPWRIARIGDEVCREYQSASMETGGPVA